MNHRLSDGSNLTFRQATAQDVSLIADFIRKLAKFEKLEHQVQFQKSDLEKNLFGEKPHAEVVFAERNGEAVGFALFFHNFSTFLGKPGLYLEDLFVNPELRSLGIGKIFLNHVLEIAKNRNCGRMEWQVLDWNTRAIEFYKKFGAKPQSDWITYRLSIDS